MRPKPDSQDDYLNEVVDLLSNKYRNKTGIIYTTTIKDAEDTCNKLRYVESKLIKETLQAKSVVQVNVVFLVLFQGEAYKSCLLSC